MLGQVIREGDAEVQTTFGLGSETQKRSTGRHCKPAHPSKSGSDFHSLDGCVQTYGPFEFSEEAFRKEQFRCRPDLQVDSSDPIDARIKAQCIISAFALNQ